jgi:hypothetical protein
VISIMATYRGLKLADGGQPQIGGSHAGLTIGIRRLVRPAGSEPAGLWSEGVGNPARRQRCHVLAGCPVTMGSRISSTKTAKKALSTGLFTIMNR